MSNITIRQAQESDIPALEGILLDNVKWVDEFGQPLWRAEDVTWDALSKTYLISDFYIAFIGKTPSGCMALVDYDPFFWPDIKKGESLIIHKLAVTKTARKSGVSDALIDFFKGQAVQRNIKTVRLDTDALRSKTRAFYERHGFRVVGTRDMGSFHVAFYVYTLSDSSNISAHKCNYRKAERSDIEILTELLCELYDNHSYDELLSENSAHFDNGRQAFFLAYCNEKPVGVCHGSLRDEYVNGKEAYGTAGYLEAIYVKPDYRLNDIASMLVAKCEEWARQNGCNEFLSDCQIDNTDSYEFHIRIGFVETERCIFFRKELTPTVKSKKEACHEV